MSARIRNLIAGLADLLDDAAFALSFVAGRIRGALLDSSFFALSYRDDFVERAFAALGLIGLGILIAGKLFGVL